MIERAVSTFRTLVKRAWLSIAFTIGLLPIALLNRLVGGGDLSDPPPSADTYWLERRFGGSGLDIWSNDDMIVRIEGRSRFGDHLRCTASPRGTRRLAGAFCLALLRPISGTVEHEEAQPDPSIYAMY